MRFVKGHGTGNDFVVIPDADGDLDLTPELVRAICDRRTGIGADGVLRAVLTAALDPATRAGLPGPPGLPGLADVPDLSDRDGTGARPGPARPARWFMDYRNGDGSLAEMCGNGARVFGRYLVDAGYASPGPIPIATRAGVRVVDVPAEGDVTVAMGAPSLGETGIPVQIGGLALRAHSVSMGNPHAVCFADSLGVDGLAALDLGAPPVVPAAAFPAGVNVEIVVPGPDGLTTRVHERGVGETASCGTGACAVAVAWAARGGDGPPTSVAVDLPGGRLRVRWASATEVLLSGPAELVADGVPRADWLRAARGLVRPAGAVRSADGVPSAGAVPSVGAVGPTAAVPSAGSVRSAGAAGATRESVEDRVS
jgi:diaminopimelate epimerase